MQGGSLGINRQAAGPGQKREGGGGDKVWTMTRDFLKALCFHTITYRGSNFVCGKRFYETTQQQLHRSLWLFGKVRALKAVISESKLGMSRCNGHSIQGATRWAEVFRRFHFSCLASIFKISDV